MKGNYIVAGLLFLLIAGLVGAEYHATTISSDGSVMLTSAGSDENGSVVSRVMALDTTKVSRIADNDKDIQEELSVSGNGPILFTEFASGMLKNSDLVSRCSFLINPDDHIITESSGVLSGILQHGELETSRTSGPSFSDMVATNGSGMIYIESQTTGNKALTSRGFVTGNLTVRDLIRNGGKI